MPQFNCKALNPSLMWVTEKIGVFGRKEEIMVAVLPVVDKQTMAFASRSEERRVGKECGWGGGGGGCWGGGGGGAGGEGGGGAGAAGGPPEREVGGEEGWRGTRDRTDPAGRAQAPFGG